MKRRCQKIHVKATIELLCTRPVTVVNCARLAFCQIHPGFNMFIYVHHLVHAMYSNNFRVLGDHDCTDSLHVLKRSEALWFERTRFVLLEASALQ